MVSHWTIGLYLNNTILCWPEDGRLTAETCRQINPVVLVHLVFVWCVLTVLIQSVPLATEHSISLIILPLMRILQRNLKRTTDTFLFISHTTNVLLLKFRCNIFIGVRIVKEMTGSVASGTHCTINNCSSRLWYHAWPGQATSATNSNFHQTLPESLILFQSWDGLPTHPLHCWPFLRWHSQSILQISNTFAHAPTSV